MRNQPLVKSFKGNCGAYISDAKRTDLHISNNFVNFKNVAFSTLLWSRGWSIPEHKVKKKKKVALHKKMIKLTTAKIFSACRVIFQHRLNDSVKINLTQYIFYLNLSRKSRNNAMGLSLELIPNLMYTTKGRVFHWTFYTWKPNKH